MTGVVVNPAGDLGGPIWRMVFNLILNLVAKRTLKKASLDARRNATSMSGSDFNSPE